MGGIGSGWHDGNGRPTVEGRLALDANRLYRDGCLEPGWTGTTQWIRDGKPLGTINLRAESFRLVLSYRCGVAEGQLQDIEDSVPIYYLACRFGGCRPYFLCPGVLDSVVCNRRVVKLFGAGCFFRCKHCHGLTHATQQKGEMDRATWRANKIRMRLGGAPGLRWSFPARPTGMWQRTYRELRRRAMAADMAADEAFAERLARYAVYNRRHPPTKVRPSSRRSALRRLS